MTVGPLDPDAMEKRIGEATRQIESTKQRLVSDLHWWSRPDYTSLLDEIENEAEKCLQYIIGVAASSKRVEAIIQVMKGRREKLALHTGITDQIIGICQQILAFGAAGLALTIGFIDKVRSLSVAVQKGLAIIAIFYTELVIVSLLVLGLYMLQARFRYPFIYFRKIGNAWPWFYYAPIYTPVCRGSIQTASTRIKASASYAGDLLKFAKECVTETPEDMLRMELQQYFLLVVYQGYVNQFSLRLANLFFYGFVGSLVSVLFLWLMSGLRIFP